jgi:hypothetical protein
MSKLYEPSLSGRREEENEDDGKRGGGAAELLTSLRDSSVSSVVAGEFGCSICRCFDDDANATFGFPFEPKDGTFIIKLFMIVELQKIKFLCLYLLLLLSTIIVQ